MIDRAIKHYMEYQGHSSGEEYIRASLLLAQLVVEHPLYLSGYLVVKGFCEARRARRLASFLKGVYHVSKR